LEDSIHWRLQNFLAKEYSSHIFHQKFWLKQQSQVKDSCSCWNSWRKRWKEISTTEETPAEEQIAEMTAELISEKRKDNAGFENYLKENGYSGYIDRYNDENPQDLDMEIARRIITDTENK